MLYKKCFRGGLALLLAAVLATGCGDRWYDDPVEYVFSEEITLENVAMLLSSLPLGSAQVAEVYDAVSASRENGYDEEYLMQDLFASPGSGVGDAPSATKASSYSRPIRDMIADLVSERYRTKAGGYRHTAQDFLDSLAASSVQIYWPFSEDWDGETLPLITFDPGDASDINVAYKIVANDTSRVLETVVVDEETARRRPVWVVNANNDACYKTVEMLRRENPNWGTGGGTLSKSAGSRTLYLRSFQAKRNFDPWFAGAAEFFVRCGSVEDVKIKKEEDLLLYNPSITDFMVVVRRKDMLQVNPFNVVLVSDWTDQLENCAFMITEDDGGTRTDWKCSATVKYNSKAYGFEMQFPLNTRDDIVWRGSLSRRYIERYSGQVGHFGDVDVVLELE